MRALIPTGQPETLIEIGLVDPPSARPDEALIKVTDISLNRADYLYLSDPASTFRPGIDAAGIVEQAAADGSGPPQGSRVVMHLPAGGGGAEYATAPADRLALIPDGVDSSTASALPLAGFVALRLLALAGSLEGRRILATGVGGGVGQIIIQLAIAQGAEITAVTAAGQPTQHITALGAKVTQDLDALEPNSFDLLLESVGGKLGSEAAYKLRTGGQYLWFGQASGHPISLDFFRLLQGGATLTLRHFIYSDGDGARDTADMDHLLRLAAEGRLQVQIGHLGDWVGAGAALKEMAAGRLQGKAVLKVT
ncbi:zinc-binding dehydrogenase [Streptomyces sp. NPDC059568]|uniref:zinc-binding dehydrogenase n=1 Tax=Streptomyces sp. NPDC059568 TaxID=3346868 RepID=UPI0036A741BB